VTSRYPEPRAGRFTPPGEQRSQQGDLTPPAVVRGYPTREPAVAQQPEPVPSADSFGWFEEFSAVAPAGTTFVEAFRFSGRPDGIHLATSGGVLDVRLRPRGGSPSTAYNITDQQKSEMQATGEIVEFRDPSGAGGTTLYGTGRFVRAGVEPRRRLSAMSEAGA
jgi:hypothetical protein